MGLDVGAVAGDADGLDGRGAEVPNAMTRMLPVCALVVTLAAASCTGGPESASAAREVSGGLFDVDRSDLSLRKGASGITVRADFRATARQASESLELDYCGPPLLFLSIDGSTVETTLDEGRLRARLHSPLQPGDDFSFRFVTVVSRDHAAPQDVANVADELFCR